MKSEDVYILIECLYQHAYKWKEIGLALHFLPGELESISHPNANPLQLLRELLSQWCQWPTATHSDVPTLESLMDALHSGPVGLGAAANDLYSKRSLLSSWYVAQLISFTQFLCFILFILQHLVQRSVRFSTSPSLDRSLDQRP